MQLLERNKKKEEKSGKTKKCKVLEDGKKGY